MRPRRIQLPSLVTVAALLSALALPRAGAAASPQAALGKGKFLVASRQLGDPNFAETVVLLLDYRPEGAMGVIINRPTEVMLTKALPDLKRLRHRRDVLYLGGPVNPRVLLLLVLAEQAPSESQPIFGLVHLSGSLNTLRHLLDENTSGDRLHAYAGYAGWGAGQLEREVERGDWYIVPANAEIIFKTPATDMWPRLIERGSGQWAMPRAMPALQIASELERQAR